jgi:hypothetical protein
VVIMNEVFTSMLRRQLDDAYLLTLDEQPLDEPTDDLDVDTLASLEHALLDFRGCAAITVHDRWFLDRVATNILAWKAPRSIPDAGIGSTATSRHTRRTGSSE